MSELLTMPPIFNGVSHAIVKFQDEPDTPGGCRCDCDSCTPDDAHDPDSVERGCACWVLHCSCMA